MCQWYVPEMPFTLLDTVLFTVLNRAYMQAPTRFDFQSRTPRQLSDRLQNVPPMSYRVAHQIFY